MKRKVIFSPNVIFLSVIDEDTAYNFIIANTFMI